MASKKFLVNLDMKQQQILNAVVHPSATNPRKPVNGQIYYNTVNKALQIYDSTGRKWRAIGTTPVKAKKKS